MKRKSKITDEKEAKEIINRAKPLIERGQKLTAKEEEEYLFAKIFLNEIRKRKKGKFPRGKRTEVRSDEIREKRN